MGIIELLLKPLARTRPTVGYPARPADSVRTTRVPRFEPDLCTDDRSCVAVCPTHAIAIDSLAARRRTWALDYGKCIFCAECVRVCPSRAIRGTGDFELAAPGRRGVVSRYELKADGDD